MQKVIETADSWLIQCQACGIHYIPRERRPNRTWMFNGNLKSPSFSPSINESVNQPDFGGYNPEILSSRCHFTITNGRIKYENDCSHALKGQTLDLKSFDESTIAYYRNHENA